MRVFRRFLGGLVRVVDTLLLAFFGLAYLAAYIRPTGATWWLQMLAIGLPFLSLAVVAAALVAFATRRRWIVHAVALGFILLRFGLPLGGETPRPDDLTIVTYNVPRYWGGMADTARARGVEAFVREAAPVVLAMQEAGSLAMDSFLVFNPQIARAQHYLGYDAPIPTGARYAHNTTLLRLTPERVDNVRLTLVPGETFTEFQRVYFTWHGREAVLYNVHLRSYGRSKPWQNGVGAMLRLETWGPFVEQYRTAILYRAAEADTLRALLDQETAATIVTGDFNSNAHTWTYRHLRGPMTDAFRATGWGWGATYHIKVPVARIDFVLAGPEWDVVAARVPDVRLSDHRPVAATLRWKDAPSDSVRTTVYPVPPSGHEPATALRTLDMVER